jgi:hypothetical protein
MLVALLSAMLPIVAPPLVDVVRLHAQSGRPAPLATEIAPLTLDEYRALLDEIESYLLRVPRPEAILPWMNGKLDAVTAVEMKPDEIVEPVNLLRNVASPQDAWHAFRRCNGRSTSPQMTALPNGRQSFRVCSISASIAKLQLWDWLLDWLQRLWDGIFPSEYDPFRLTGRTDRAMRDLWRVIIRLVAIAGAVVITLLLGCGSRG